MPSNAILNRNFYHFLMTQEPEIAYEVRQDYVQTMSKLYYSYFKASNFSFERFSYRLTFFYSLCRVTPRAL